MWLYLRKILFYFMLLCLYPLIRTQYQDTGKHVFLCSTTICIETCGFLWKQHTQFNYSSQIRGQFSLSSLLFYTAEEQLMQHNRCCFPIKARFYISSKLYSSVEAILKKQKYNQDNMHTAFCSWACRLFMSTIEMAML